METTLATKQYVDDNLKPNEKPRELLMNWFLPQVNNGVYSKKIWDGLTPTETLEKLKTYENFLLEFSYDNGGIFNQVKIDKITFNEVNNTFFMTFLIYILFSGNSFMRVYLQSPKYEVQIYKYGPSTVNYSNVRFQMSAQPGDKYPDPV